MDREETVKEYILAIDQGTTGSRAVLYDRDGAPRASSYEEFRQYFPKPGWVEHDPEEIWASVYNSVQEVLRKMPEAAITAIGITNQRETTLLWDRETGRSVYNAIVWQCRRTAGRCASLKKEKGARELFMKNTGLPIDAYFSATKIEWLLKNVKGLHTLPIFNLAQGIDIYLPRGGERLLRGFLRRPFTSPPLVLPTRIRLRDATKKTRFAFGFEAMRLQHSVPCYGYRFDIEGRRITYCTDTGMCRNLTRLAKNTDLLMTECALSPCDKSANLFHLTPQTAAHAASKAGAKKLFLVHFDPGKYPTFAARDEAERAARKIFAETVAAKDGTSVTL